MRFFIINISLILFSFSCKNVKLGNDEENLKSNKEEYSKPKFSNSYDCKNVFFIRIKNATFNHYNRKHLEVSKKEIIDKLCNQIGRVKRIDSFAETKNNFGLYSVNLFDKESNQVDEVIITYTVYNGIIVRFMSHPDDRYKNDDLEKLVDSLMINHDNE